MNALTTSISRSSLPAPLPGKAATAVAAFVSALDPKGLGYEIRAEAAPNAEQRAWLENRRDVLRSSLAPMPALEMTSELAGLFSSLAFRNAEEGEANGRLRVYMGDLADVAGCALRQAFSDFRRGKVGDGQWVPSQAQIRQRANEIIAPIQAELSQIEKVLNAKVNETPVNAEYKAEVNRHVQETIAILKAASDKPKDVVRPPTPKEAESWLEAEKTAPWCQPISDELARSLGLKRDGEAA